MIPFGTQKAPSASVVTPYYVTAAIAFLIVTTLMLLSAGSFTGHYFQPHLLAITHIAALGWGTMIIFGASHQLLPVVMEVHLYSEKLAAWCYRCLLPGVILLAVSFWNFSPGWPMETGALLILTAVILYSLNVYATARQNRKWNISAECMVTASWWLLFTATLGTLLVFNLRYAFFPLDHLYYLKIHAHAGMAGWFLLLIMGVASRLVPMFLLSHREPGRLVRWSYYLLNGSLLGFVIMSLVFNTEKYWPVFAAAALAAVITYAFFIRHVWKEAVRKKMDAPMKITLAAIVLMLLPFLLLTALASLGSGAGQETVRISLAYGFSILGGFITAIILGQTFKTFPFIIWMHRYKNLAGKTKTPLPRELYRETWVRYQFYAYLAGYCSLLAGIISGLNSLIFLGCSLLLLTAVFYNLNIFQVLLHKIKKENVGSKP